MVEAIAEVKRIRPFERSHIERARGAGHIAVEPFHALRLGQVDLHGIDVGAEALQLACRRGELAVLPGLS